MDWSLRLKIKPQFIETTDFQYQGNRLHNIQKFFYDFDGLKELNIIVAPTGTGKSFAFPLPIVQKRESGGLSKRRGLIVSPTNALIEDMQKVYNRDFPEIKVAIINRKALDELEVHGLERWNAVLQTLRDNEIAITNPDLLNFAIFSGYQHKKLKGQPQFNELLAMVDYFVFDEYHLYDEEQIANILTYIILAKKLVSGKKTKFIFSSATPEKGLEELFQQQGWDSLEFTEPIAGNESPTVRMIHGEIEVQFLKESSIVDYLIANKAMVYRFVQKGDRVLVIFDRLRELQQAKLVLRGRFPDLQIAEESGYITHAEIQEKLRQRLENAHIILGTNKIEVGVNLDVDICFMQPGRYHANFLQRFGRVARGKREGKAFVFVDEIQKLRRIFNGKEMLSYYEFTELYLEILKEKKFYTERIPNFLGAFLFVIPHAVADHSLRKVFHDRVKIEGEMRFMWSIMTAIDIRINELAEINKNLQFRHLDEVKCWKQWWSDFSDTFKYFRQDTVNVKVRDLDYEDKGGEPFFTTYSYEWILVNKNIVDKGKANGEDYLVVSGFTDFKPELQYVVPTMPVGNINPANIYLKQNEKKFELKNAFDKRVAILEEIYTKRVQDDFSRKSLELLSKLSQLKTIFTEKRLKIKDIIESSNVL